MNDYTVTLFGEQFKESTNSPYDARNQAAIDYKKKTNTTLSLAYLRSKTKIRISQTQDKRIKFAF